VSIQFHRSRRDFLCASVAIGSGVAATTYPTASSIAAAAEVAAKPKEKADETDEVSPAEDLMREHGALRRILLVYDEARRRLRQQKELDPQWIQTAAGIVRRFVEDYHEKLEEDHLFPRFEKAQKLMPLVQVLRQQHQAGRQVTDRIKELATADQLKSDEGRRRLAELLTTFNRMYRPHAAREDTVLFPALHEIIKSAEYETLGDVFEKREDELFGEHGFEKIVDQVAELEKSLGIYDLASFTAKA
jgi:hemerythrin-like domain-containing protein